MRKGFTRYLWIPEPWGKDSQDIYEYQYKGNYSQDIYEYQYKGKDNMRRYEFIIHWEKVETVYATLSFDTQADDSSACS